MVTVSWELEPFTGTLKLKQSIADPKDLGLLSGRLFSATNVIQKPAQGRKQRNNPMLMILRASVSPGDCQLTKVKIEIAPADSSRFGLSRSAIREELDEIRCFSR